MKYELLIYAGSNTLSALNVDGDNMQYISMNGNTEHPADDISEFYEHLLDYYNVDDLSEIKAGIRIINGGADKKNIDFLLHKFSDVNDLSLWRVEELLPVILINKNTLDKGKPIEVKVYDRSYVVGADEEFNVNVSYTDGTDIELSLEDFTLFNKFNGSGFKQDTELIESMMNKIRNLESEKAILQQKLSRLISNESYCVGNVIEFGKYEGKPVNWRIIKKNNDSVYLISEEILCSRVFSENNSNDWTNSDLRKWLNGEFYTNTFNEKEKSRIIKTDGDNLTLMTKKEAEILLNREARNKGTWWWLRLHCADDSYGVWNVGHDGLVEGFIFENLASLRGGVRPVLNLSLN